MSTILFSMAGISLQNIEQYAARPNRHVIQPPQQAPAPRTPAMLSAGSKAKPAPHIPFHLPPLPDPHAYIRTPVSYHRKQDDSSNEPYLILYIQLYFLDP